ncbi:MAG: hypothetical protein K2U26_00115 [Cyclobacteriaceae bacterium]|nr:hypothetical protein [Cyclobacteriaceae bacterium]
MITLTATRSLDEQRIEFAQKRFLAMPLAGTLVWAAIAVLSLYLSPIQIVWALYVGTGSIAYLGILFSKFTGENFTDKSKPKNEFDTLFFYTVFMAWLVFSIAIPLAGVDYTSLPLTVGIMAGLMWLPFSWITWIIKHWIGIFHSVARTISLVVLWYLFPNHRFLVLPVAIVVVYLITIVVLEMRWRKVQS